MAEHSSALDDGGGRSSDLYSSMSWLVLESLYGERAGHDVIMCWMSSTGCEHSWQFGDSFPLLYTALMLCVA